MVNRARAKVKSNLFDFKTEATSSLVAFATSKEAAKDASV